MRQIVGYVFWKKSEKETFTMFWHNNKDLFPFSEESVMTLLVEIFADLNFVCKENGLKYIDKHIYCG